LLFAVAVDEFGFEFKVPIISTLANRLAALLAPIAALEPGSLFLALSALFSAVRYGLAT
jgi:hypothetical protein